MELTNDDHSEDGQLRSPYNNNADDDDEMGDNDSIDGVDTADSLDIKPPQARSEHRYKDKKSRDKKHSRERRHKDKDRSRDRSSRTVVDRQHISSNSSRGRSDGHRDRGGGGSDRDRAERDRHHKQPQRHQTQQSLQPPTSNSVDVRYEMDTQREREYYRHVYKDRERSGGTTSATGVVIDTQSVRIKEQQQQQQYIDRRPSNKDSPLDKTDADRVLEDLRSRLLSKRNKQDAERRIEQQNDQHNENDYRTERAIYAVNSRKQQQQQQEHYEYKRSSNKDDTMVSSRKEHHHKKHKSRKEVEEIDSPENYSDIGNDAMMVNAAKYYKEEKNKIISEDPELIARRAKLLEAEREMARRKELAREELEARREQRRERQDANLASPNQSPNVIKKRRQHQRKVSEIDDEDDDEVEAQYRKVEQRKRRKGDEIVHISDNSADDTASDDTDTNSNTDTDDGGDGSDDGELPVSPLSVGELSKSERRRRSATKSKSRSKSRSSLSRSHSRSRSRSRRRSRSRSKSHSRTPSHSPQLRKRSRSPTPDSDFEKLRSNDRGNGGDSGNTAPTVGQTAATTSTNVTENNEILSPDAIVEQLPNYYPGIQGCRSVEEFQCLNRIEEGTYGVVYRARDKRTEEIVALKRLKMEKEREGFPITSLREINTLLKGQHPNIVTVREIVVGSNMDKIFIVMDYVEHDLKSLMETMKHRKQGFLPAEVKCLTQQLLRAVGHLHDNWILHRDLKTSNLLLSHKGILKVGDFGLAREYGSPLKAYTSVVVTLWYRAPELLLCCKEYSTPIDMWSVGCIFAELLSMSALFTGKSEIDQLNRIFKDLGTPNEKIWPGYNELPAVQKMTFTEYPVSNLRKKFSHLISELGMSLLQGLLTYDPKQRFTADQALKNSYFKELPLPIDPAMFPTWPAKSELGARKALASSPKPPSGGREFKQLGEAEDNHGFILNQSMDTRQLAMGPGFSLKF